MYRLKRHPFEIEAFLRRSLVLGYALPAEALEPLLQPGLSLDRLDKFGFLAVAMVETESLRPAGMPKWLGRSFFLTGYRLFVRYKSTAGKNLRGLQILRSDADQRLMVALGGALSHYRYRMVDVDAKRNGDEYSVRVKAPSHAPLRVVAHLDDASLPASTVFADLREARRFAGPMPFTFSFEAETRSVLRIEGVRTEWVPKSVRVEIPEPPDFREFGIDPSLPRLTNAFYLENVPYRWKRGVVEPIGA